MPRRARTTDAEASGIPNPRRIALVIDYSLAYLGGAQSAFLDEARLLRQAGHEVTIVGPVRSGDRWPEEWVASAADGRGRAAAIPIATRATVPVVDLPLKRNTALVRYRLDREFWARRIDTVHVHSEFGLSAAAISVARRRGFTTAQTVHTFFWQAALPAGVPRWVARLGALGVRGFGRMLRGFPSRYVAPDGAPLAPAPIDAALRGLTASLAARVGVVISPSAHQAEKLRAAGLAPVAVVPNALAVAGSPGVALAGVDGALRIVWVGRLVPEKRLLEWIEAVRIAVARGASIEVEVVGEGPLRAEAERAARGLPVRFAGRLPRAEVHERMSAAHLVALTSNGFDNQPVTIVEALHARRGVFYVDAALTEGVDVAGVRASSPEPAAMAELLVELAADPARVVAASRAAAEGAAAFDPDAHVARVLAAYAEADRGSAARAGR